MVIAVSLFSVCVRENKIEGSEQVLCCEHLKKRKKVYIHTDPA